MFPITFASGAFVPAGTMPGWLQAWINVNPVTILSDAVRGLLVGGPVASPVAGSLLWAAGLLAVFAPLAVRAFIRRL
jgi:ABC-type multidrug transport system permease subunit